MFKYTDGRDVGLVIDKRPDASKSSFKIEVLPSCVRIANKYGREREISNHGKERGSATCRVIATEWVRTREGERSSPLDVNRRVRDMTMGS